MSSLTFIWAIIIMVLNGNRKINFWFWLIMSNIWHPFWLLVIDFDPWVGALTWFETAWSYGVKVIDYWIIVEPLFQWKLIKIKIENCIGIWVHYRRCWKALGESNLIEFIPQFSKLRCGRYYFCVNFDARIQTICKNWVWNEKSVEPSMSLHLGQWHRLH
jgi:hypothetical protein